MKKMVFMAAFVAATAAFVACSSNDDLVQQKPDVPEEQIEEKVPMKIIVSDLASRGNDFNSTTNPLTTFKLYSTMNDSWTSGKAFEKPSSSWTVDGADLTWETGGPFTFFGINDVDNLADLDKDGHKDAPVVTATTCSFNYAMPQEEKTSDPGNYWCNSENLPDLLVSKNTGSSSLNDGKLTVDFTHALAQIKAINIYANSTRLEAKSVTDHQTYRFRINGIRLGGLKYIGTYTFDANPAWVVSGDDTEFTIPLDESQLTYAKTWFKPGADKTTGITLPLTDGGLYLIPQVANGSFVKDEFDLYLSSGAYAELDAQVFVYQYASKTGDNDDGVYRSCSSSNAQVLFNATRSDLAGYGKIRVPLIFSLAPGYGYTLTLDLSRGVYYDGSFEGNAIFDGITFDSGS